MRTIFTIVFLCFSGSLFSQEILTGLEVNPVVRQKALELRTLKGRAVNADTTPVSMPFFDNFKKNTVFPSPEWWSDRWAFVNDDIPVYPVNYGAVTLDAVSDTGTMYPNAVPGPDPFIADRLTSRYIRLDSVFDPVPRAITRADSIYLSFWYQPQGRGKAPQVHDSLVLRFFVRAAFDSITPTDTIHVPDRWERVWRTKGTSLDTFYLNNNRYFVQVMIPITDSVKYFKPNFRFQFYNYVSLASQAEPSWQANCSQWNIDDVYLNTGRSMADTVIPELSFIYRPPSMLKYYSVMPYPQYSDDPTTELADSIDVLMSNRDVVNHNSSYKYTVTQPGGSFNKTYSGGEYVIKPIYTDGYVTYVPFAHPPVSFLFPIGSADSITYNVTHYLTATDGSGLGDTITVPQHFTNYYAYDDGTPEAGYGVTPAGSKIAYRFSLSKSPDTLRAIQIYFNRTLSGTNQQFFSLSVWNDNAGTPGILIYDTLDFPRFADSLNQFVTYHLVPPVKVTGTFYIGVVTTTDDNLNIGFDRYNNSQDNLLYNVSGQWAYTAYSGSLMMRPIVGKPIPLGIPAPESGVPRALIFPNPSHGEPVHISVGGSGFSPGSASAIITDLYGRQVLVADPSGPIGVRALASGVYLLTVADTHGVPMARGKFIITH
jgi:hypothetical protein